MATWSEVQEFARRRYTLVSDSERDLVIAFPLATEGATSEAQHVHVQPLIEFGEPWLLLRAAVCSEQALDLKAALQRCGRQVMGALVLADHLIALRQGMPLATLRPEDFQKTVQVLARTAAYMRKHLRAPAFPMIPDTAGKSAEPSSDKNALPEEELFSSWVD
jgi:hypothetical protein